MAITFNNTTKSFTGIASPQAMAIIWNYDDRMTQPRQTTNNNQEIERKILTTASIRSIRTQKTKSTPAGAFELELAPTTNWLSALTVGSWVAILMTRDMPITDIDTKTARQDRVKMLGRIDSVRVSVTVNPETGARQTSFIVTGRDWGSIFESTVYVDTLYGALLQNTPASAATSPFTDKFVSTKQDAANFGAATTSDLVEELIKFYGMETFRKNQSTNLPETAIPDQIFKLPGEVATYFQFLDGDNLPSKQISKLIKLVRGKLDRYDHYYDIAESVGIINPASLVGSFSFWQILTEYSNPVINELVAEMRWESLVPGVEKPSMALYKRVKPFTVDMAVLEAQVKNGATAGDGQAALAAGVSVRTASKFGNIKNTPIALEDIISIDAGTNWRDRINFVEVLYDDANFKALSEQLNSMIKPNAQISDKFAPQREGLKPMLVRSRFWPAPAMLPVGQQAGSIAQLAIAQWKYLLENWYFSTHNMLNGALVMVGQNNYIGVGENILVPAKVIMPTYNMSSTPWVVPNIDNVFLLAHVESIAHQFAVGDDGARTFSTTVQFVRGIFTDADGNPFEKGEFAGLTQQDGILDKNAGDLDKAKKHLPNVISKSTELDPDTAALFKV